METTLTKKNTTSTKPKAQLQLTWILDITSSMSTQLKACKKAAETTAKVVSRGGLPVSFSVITYTEDIIKSYSSFNTFEDVDEAVKFIQKIEIGCPPNTKHIKADGGDNDKNDNFKLALATLHQNHDFSVPSVVFLLTDAGYHIKGDKAPRSLEAQAETRELEKRGYSDDIFEIWSKIPHEKIFFFPMLFGYECLDTYAQLATQTSGLLMKCWRYRPTKRQISDAMLAVINQIFDLLVTGYAEPLREIKDFDLVDCSQISFRSSEAQQIGRDSKLIWDASAEKAMIQTTMKKVVEEVGKGWTKRKINLDARSLSKQIQLVAFCLKFISGRRDLKTMIQTLSKVMKSAKKQVELVDNCVKYISGGKKLQKKIQSLLKEVRALVKSSEQKKCLSLNMGLIHSIKAAMQPNLVAEELEDYEELEYLTLQTLKDEVEAASLDEVKKDFTASICSVLYGLPANVQFQEDELGNLDFSRIWDCEVSGVGVDKQSLKTFVKLTEGKTRFLGLSDRKVYTGFIPLSGKPGTLRWAIFRIAGHLQVLNAAMSLSAGLPMTEIIPNLHAGVLSKSLMFMTKSALNQQSFNRITQILASIEALPQTPAANLAKMFKEAEGEEIPALSPSEPINKLLVVWYRQSRDNKQLLKTILRELMTSQIDSFFKKKSPENDSQYKEYLKDFFRLEEVFGDFEEKVHKIHPLEKAGVDLEALEAFFTTGGSTDPLVVEIGTKLSEYLKSDVLADKIATNSLYKDFRTQAMSLWTVLHADTRKSNLPRSRALERCYREVQHDFVQSLLLRKRAARFSKEVDEDGNEVWIERKIESNQLLIFKLLKSLYKDVVRGREERREFLLRKKLVRNLKGVALTDCSIAKQGNSKKMSIGQWVKVLARNKMEVNSKTHQLARKDVVELCLSGVKNLNLLEAAVSGNWSKEVPHVLSRLAAEIKHFLKNAKVSEKEIRRILRPILSQAVCGRRKPNRRGHSSTLPYPGPHRWTRRYHEQRLQNGGKEKYLAVMRLFTKAYKKIKATKGVNLEKLEAIVVQFHDAFNIQQFIKKVIREFPEAEFDDFVLKLSQNRLTPKFINKDGSLRDFVKVKNPVRQKSSQPGDQDGPRAPKKLVVSVSTARWEETETINGGEVEEEEQLPPVAAVSPLDTNEFPDLGSILSSSKKTGQRKKRRRRRRRTRRR